MSPPLTPDADEARRQLTDELNNPAYANVGSWISDQLNKILDWLTGHPESTHALSGGQLAAITLTVLALAAITVWTLLGPLRSERRRHAEVFADEERTAEQLLADAAGLAGAGDWAGATLGVFRAMVRSLSERGIVEEFAGMTAHEAATRAASRLPGLAGRLASAAEVFDTLAYGRRDGTPQQYEAMVALANDAAGARPASLAAASGSAAQVTVESVR